MSRRLSFFFTLFLWSSLWRFARGACRSFNSVFLEVDLLGVPLFLWLTSGFKEAFGLDLEEIRDAGESSELSSSIGALEGCRVT